MMCFIVAVFTGVFNTYFFQMNPQSLPKWYPSVGGCKFHVASTLLEWIVAAVFCFFFILTFTDELKLSVDHPPIAIKGYENFQILDYVMQLLKSSVITHNKIYSSTYLFITKLLLDVLHQAV